MEIKNKKSKFFVGIDLGTTNSVLSYAKIPKSNEELEFKFFEFKQKTHSDNELKSIILASEIFIPSSSSVKQDPIIGQGASKESLVNPGRVVRSAKSWIGATRFDSFEAFLPWRSAVVADDNKISPFQAQSLVLGEILQQWNDRFPDAELKDQVVTITVPSSFDYSAQQVTLKAAKSVGFSASTTMVEEPLSAFYSFLYNDKNKDLIKSSKVIIVIDIGGGTSDFTLILEEDGSFERLDVSNHILLGGDNVDYKIASALQQRFGVQKLTPKEWEQLILQSRQIKEDAFNGDRNHSVVLTSDSSDIFSDSKTASISSVEVREIVLTNFFPEVDKDSSSIIKKSGGLRVKGLPFPEDTAITRHLMSFLNSRKVDSVFFNGGSLAPLEIRERILKVINNCQDTEAKQLPFSDMFGAVAKGASAFSSERYYNKKTVKTTFPYSLYLMVGDNANKKYLTVLEKGADTSSTSYKEFSSLEFSTYLGQDLVFPLLSSRKNSSKFADVIDKLPSDAQALQPLIGRFAAAPKEQGKNIKVSLATNIDEFDNFYFLCKEASTQRQWQLEFGLRDRGEGSYQSSSSSIDTQTSEPINDKIILAESCIKASFGKPLKGTARDKIIAPSKVLKRIEVILGKDKQDWSVSTLRTLWSSLSAGITRRGRSPDHESRFFYLAGLILRPGFGYPLDETRINELWRCFELGLSFPKSSESYVQSSIMWRRVVGGLSSERQLLLFERRIQNFLSCPETMRLLASCERVPLGRRKKLLTKLVSELTGKKKRIGAHHTWALGRLLSRISVYSEEHSVLPPHLVEKSYIDLQSIIESNPEILFAFAHAVTEIEDSTLNVEPEFRSRIIQKIKTTLKGKFKDELIMVAQYKDYNDQESVSKLSVVNEKLLGDTLPLGLKILG